MMKLLPTMHCNESSTEKQAPPEHPATEQQLVVLNDDCMQVIFFWYSYMIYNILKSNTSRQNSLSLRTTLSFLHINKK